MKTILVVDDDEVALAAATETLEGAGYRVSSRNRSTGCVALILREKPDLVLVDVCLPTVSGDMLVKMVRAASPRGCSVLLLYSALDEPLLRAKAKAAGADGYVSKTAHRGTLLATVKKSLANATALAEHAAAEPVPPSAEARSQRFTRERAELDRAVGSAVSGHRWRLSLPPKAERSPSKLPPQLTAPSGARLLAAPTVLLVDDDMLALSSCRRQLSREPYHFEFALSGAQAIRLVMSDRPPQVVVSDLRMPDPGGVEVLRRALDYDLSWRSRFVIVTGMQLDEARASLDRRFAGTVLAKPIDARALSAAIHTSIDVATGADQAPRAHNR